jgi:hypothetical protein
MELNRRQLALILLVVLLTEPARIIRRLMRWARTTRPPTSSSLGVERLTADAAADGRIHRMRHGESTMKTRNRRLRRAAVPFGAVLVLAATTFPSPGWAASRDMDPIPIVWPDCFGRTYLPPQYFDGQLIHPGTPGVIFAVPGVKTVGTAGDDLIIGTTGPDLIFGMAGDDTICGGDGADDISGDDAFDEVEPGDDMIHGENATDDLYGGGGNDTIYGGNNHPNSLSYEELLGGDGVDRLFGENGADTLMCGTFSSDPVDPGDFANGGTGMPGNAPEADRSPGWLCPLSMNIETQ